VRTVTGYALRANLCKGHAGSLFLLIGWSEGLGFTLARIGLEAGPLSQWFHAALVRAGYQAVLL
jgi:hypothetical protein